MYHAPSSCPHFRDSTVRTSGIGRSVQLRHFRAFDNRFVMNWPRVVAERPEGMAVCEHCVANEKAAGLIPATFPQTGSALGFFNTYTQNTKLAPHTGHSSQLVFEANDLVPRRPTADRNGRYLALTAGNFLKPFSNVFRSLSTAVVGSPVKMGSVYSSTSPFRASTIPICSLR